MRPSQNKPILTVSTVGMCLPHSYWLKQYSLHSFCNRVSPPLYAHHVLAHALQVSSASFFACRGMLHIGVSMPTTNIASPKPVKSNHQVGIATAKMQSVFQKAPKSRLVTFASRSHYPAGFSRVPARCHLLTGA